ncbi:MAG: cytidylate kinase-like family protein [Ruminococcus sp.]|nr:cytidylate kinase-like family protein [Ruminococcus sp.]
MKSVITIGREFGSGGREIGRLIADKYGIPFYDKELLEESAKHSGICEDLFVSNDESCSNSFLYSLVMGTYPTTADGRINPEMPLNHRIFLAQFETIKRLSQSPCVIVGRCADYVLQDHKNMVSVFVTGDMVEKKRRIGERYDIEKLKIEDFIKKTDKRRANYYEYYTDKKWGAAKNYDLCVNSSKVGIDGAVSTICAYVELKENKT